MGPSARCGHTFTAIDKNRAVLIGGMNEKGEGLNDVFIFKLHDMEWEEISSAIGRDRLYPCCYHSALWVNFPGNPPYIFLFLGQGKSKKRPVK
eukprot:m.213941 g.213941  ORF g.213941 m.213941 type:complete len:93 (+) comp39802_c1_seq14:828-1106(+)